VTKGTVVTIHFGPFAGLSGVVIATTPQRTVVRLILQGRSVPVELETNMIRVPIRDAMQRPAELRPRSRPA
jgi:transcription antitermination factor NusG